MPTPSQAARTLAGGAEFDFAEGYPSAFVVQLFRLLAEFPVDLSSVGGAASVEGAPPAGDRASDTEPLLGPWIASCGADGRVVGALSCAPVFDRTEGSQSISAVTVGYDVAPSCEGRGYATEMMRLVCAHLLAQPGVVRVCAETEADHGASRRVMEKAGLTWRSDETDVRDGRTVTVVHYALDRTPPS